MLNLFLAVMWNIYKNQPHSPPARPHSSVGGSPDFESSLVRTSRRASKTYAALHALVNSVAFSASTIGLIFANVGFVRADETQTGTYIPPSARTPTAVYFLGSADDVRAISDGS